MAGHTEETYLEVPGGKFAEVKKDTKNKNTKLHIAVRHVQMAEQKKKVSVHMIPGEQNHVGLVFGFLYKKQKYFLSVNGNNLVLKEKVPSDSHFQWEKDGGEWCVLKSVAEPSKYLCVENDEVTVSSDKSSYFRLHK